MKTGQIKSSWFYDKEVRIDPSYHLSDGIKTERLINDFCPYEKVTIDDECTEIYKGNIHKRVYVNSPSHGFTFYSASDLFKVGLDTGKYVSKKYSPYLDELKFHSDWILITRSGTLGKVVLTNKNHEGKIGTDDLVRLKPKNNRIRIGYMYAFLASKFGYGLLTQSGYGGVVKHIEPHHVENIEIPIIPNQKQIDELIIKSTKLRVEANQLLSEADNLFHKLNNLSYSSPLTEPSENALQYGYSVKKTELFKTTIKARNHSLRANKIMEIWESKTGFKFKEKISSDGLTRGMGGFFKRIKDDGVKGMDIVSQGDIHQSSPKYKQVIKKGIKSSEVAKKGMVIMPAAGTLGENEIFVRPKLIYKNFEGKVLSEVVGKIRPENIEHAAYLFAALNSIGGFRILRAMVYGTNLLYPNWELLKNLNIPCKDEETLALISKTIIEYYEKIAHANQAENEAIGLVEKEIESWQK